MTKPLIEQWLPAAAIGAESLRDASSLQSLATDQLCSPRLVGAPATDGESRSSARLAPSGMAE